jgi:membrane protease YdiL (CAAX protease family)
VAFDWIDPKFGPYAIVVVVAVLVLVALAPIGSRRALARLRAARAQDPNALVRFYRRSIVVSWLVTGMVVGTLVVGPGVQPVDLGLVWPSGGYAWLAAALAAYLVVVVLIGGIRARRRLPRAAAARTRSRAAVLMPETRRERRLAVVVSVTVGVFEETVYRGFLVAVGVGLFRLPAFVAAAVSLALFAVAHLYQGWYGVVSSALVGALLTTLYALSGTLLFSMVVHAVIDLVALVVVPAQPSTPPEPVPVRTAPTGP